jgi:GT2 family glycosyltransferase
MKYLLLVPCYNAAHLLPFFFQSLRNMNPKPDYIVWSVNNCTDNTVQTLKDFYDVPSEIIQLPDFPRDFTKRHDKSDEGGGSSEHMAIIRQRLWERARQLNADWTFMCDVDMFAASTDVLDIMSGWKVDYVAARILRYQQGEYRLNANWHGSPRKFKEPNYACGIEYDLIPKELIVARPPPPELPALDSTPTWACGFYCFSRRLVQDRRLNWHPRLKGFSEDIGFCTHARKLGYQPHLDCVVTIDHVAHDSKTPLKPWSVSECGELTGKKYFEFGESKSQ